MSLINRFRRASSSAWKQQKPSAFVVGRRTKDLTDSAASHHSELGLGLLQQVVLLGLANAGEDARFRVEVQDVAFQVC